MPSKPYHQRFQSLHPNLIKTTNRFFDAHPFRGDDDRKLHLYQTWLQYASEIYDVPTPNLVYRPDVDEVVAAGGIYLPIARTIILGKLSVTTLFHEYRHHLQASGKTTVKEGQGEDDARAWSLSLFYTVRPRLFAKSVKAGKILFVAAEDLTNERRM